MLEEFTRLERGESCCRSRDHEERLCVEQVGSLQKSLKANELKERGKRQERYGEVHEQRMDIEWCHMPISYALEIREAILCLRGRRVYW